MAIHKDKRYPKPPTQGGGPVSSGGGGIGLKFIIVILILVAVLLFLGFEALKVASRRGGREQEGRRALDHLPGKSSHQKHKNDDEDPPVSTAPSPEVVKNEVPHQEHDNEAQETQSTTSAPLKSKVSQPSQALREANIKRKADKKSTVEDAATVPQKGESDDGDDVNAAAVDKKEVQIVGDKNLPPKEDIMSKFDKDGGHGIFFKLYNKKLKKWFGRAIDTNIETAKNHEKIFKTKKMNSGRRHGWAIQGHTRLHLTCEPPRDKITLDRPWVRGYEMFSWEFDVDKEDDDQPIVYLKSLRNDKYVRVYLDHQSLVGDVSTKKEATKWTMYRERSCDNDVDCWGPLNKKKKEDAETLAEANELDKELAKMTFPIFTTPKPLAKLATTKVGSELKYDPFTIARRTLDNWLSIPGMNPLIFTDDGNVETLVADCNKKHAELSDDGGELSGDREGGGEKHHDPAREIKLSADFEQHNKFNKSANQQPTYRGLFAKALELYPEAEAIMFSNGDILYTPALPETIREVIRYVKTERARVKKIQGAKYKVKGWMMVGQRINHDIPPAWQLRDPSTSLAPAPATKKKKHSGGGRKSWDGLPWWVRDIEEKFSDSGELFQSNAEDFFIVSRDLFDWMDEIGDFIVGGVAFDNWIVARAIRMADEGEAIVVDASKTITALHQNHGADRKDSHLHPKSRYNSHLAAKTGGVSRGKTAEAAYATERQGDGTITVYDKHRLIYL